MVGTWQTRSTSKRMERKRRREGEKNWRAYLIGMRSGNEEHWTALRDLPRTPRNDFAEEGIDQVADDVHEEVVLPIDHGIQLLLTLGVGRGLRRRGALSSRP